ncbi:MAG: mandelate racemase/muconate lactonizing enzyme family protein [Haloferacaceae archaeon]
MSVRVAPFALALDPPLGTARGEIQRRRGLLVTVERDGVRGVGEASPLPGWTESLADCRAALDDATDRLNADDGDVDGDVDRAALDSLDGTPAARHGLALALLDAEARAAGRSLAASIADGPPATRVPVNATVGDGPPAATADAVRAAVESGFDCVKVKVGAGSLDRDVARLQAARDAAGPGVALRADANGAWDHETAARAVEGFADLDLAHLEQPLPAGDLAGHRDLRGRGVGVALDESVARAGVGAVLDADAADVVVVKPMALGGPERAVAAARRARREGVEPVVTTTVDAAVARAAAVHVAAAVPDVEPCGLATGDRLVRDLVPDPVPVETGAIRVPEGPGTAGTAFDGLPASLDGTRGRGERR